MGSAPPFLPKDSVPRMLAVLAAHEGRPFGGVGSGFRFRDYNYLITPGFWERSDHEAAGALAPAAAIEDFHSQLKARGIELLVIFPPNLTAIYPDQATNIVWDFRSQGRVDGYFDSFMRILRAKGITVVDLVPELVLGRYGVDAEARLDPAYFASNLHWTPRGAGIAAAKVAEEIRSRPWFPTVKQLGTPTAPRISGALPESSTASASDTPPGSSDVTDANDREAAIQLIGDSFSYWPNEGDGSFHRQLTKLLGVPVALTGIAGSGPNVAPRQWAARADLKRTKLVVWEIEANSLTRKNVWTRIELDRRNTLSLVDLCERSVVKSSGVSPNPTAASGLVQQRSIATAWLYGKERATGGPEPEERIGWANVRLGTRSSFSTFLGSEIPEQSGGSLEFELRVEGKVVATRKLQIKPRLGWEKWEVDLSAFAGEATRLELVTRTQGSSKAPTALWGEPEISDARLGAEAEGSGLVAPSPEQAK